MDDHDEQFYDDENDASDYDNLPDLIDATDFPLNTSQLADRYGLSLTAIRTQLKTYEEVTGRLLPRDSANGRIVPANIVGLFDQTNAKREDFASYREALVATIKVSRFLDVGTVINEFQDRIPTKSTNLEIDEEITTAIKSAIEQAGKTQMRAISSIQDRTEEVAHRLDLADRQSIALIRELTARVQEFNTQAQRISAAVNSSERSMNEINRVMEKAVMTGNAVQNFWFTIAVISFAFLFLNGVIWLVIYQLRQIFH
jgi:predicted XRE-type DNA-binding protein